MDVAYTKARALELAEFQSARYGVTRSTNAQVHSATSDHGNTNDEHQDQSSDFDPPLRQLLLQERVSSVDKHGIQDRDAELVIVLAGTVARLDILQLCASREYNKKRD
ncbi:hypothetical protein GJ496_004977 [Pomphorhynchus laevis]|nr:hypothetical protein GJ496_004977 [Pomphorhynchus laevis]